MSYSQLIRGIREHSDEEGRELFKELLKTTGKIQPDYAAGALQMALDDGDLDAAPDLIDELEESLEKSYIPQPPEVNVHKKDMFRWFEFMRHFVEIGRLDGANDIMWFYSHMFNTDGKTRCGSIRSRCSQANDGTCIYKYQKDEYVCPKCDTARSFCRRRPGSNGRCTRTGRSRGHGGDMAIGALSPSHIDGRDQLSRRNIFAKQLEHRPKLQRMFIEALQDPNYLSLEPEIALIAMRRGELLADLDELDPATIEAGVEAAVKGMRTAITKEKYDSAIYHAQEIEDLLQGGRDNRARWREMNSLAGQMAKLADTERKRIVEARKMVTVEEMLLLRNETVKVIRTAVIDGAETIYRDFMKAVESGTLHKMSPDYIRQAMLRQIAKRLRPLEEAERAEVIDMVDEADEEE
jgi:hypothetical protein